MVTHVFDNSNLSQEIFAIDTTRAVICSFGHDHKHMLTILPTTWRPGFTNMMTNVNLLYSPDSIEIACLEGLTLCLPEINQSKQPFA